MMQLLSMSGAAISNAISQAAGTAITGIIAILILAWCISMLFVIPTVAVITWVVKKVWYHKGRNNNNQNYIKYR